MEELRGSWTEDGLISTHINSQQPVPTPASASAQVACARQRIPQNVSFQERPTTLGQQRQSFEMQHGYGGTQGQGQLLGSGQLQVEAVHAYLFKLGPPQYCCICRNVVWMHVRSTLSQHQRMHLPAAKNFRNAEPGEISTALSVQLLPRKPKAE
jgi:hypothetical protein